MGRDSPAALRSSCPDSSGQLLDSKSGGTVLHGDREKFSVHAAGDPRPSWRWSLCRFAGRLPASPSSFSRPLWKRTSSDRVTIEQHCIESKVSRENRRSGDDIPRSVGNLRKCPGQHAHILCHVQNQYCQIATAAGEQRPRTRPHADVARGQRIG